MLAALALSQAAPDYTEAEALDGTVFNQIALTANSNLQGIQRRGSGSCDLQTANVRLEWLYIPSAKSLATH